jgi:Rrf2 family protein
MADIATQCKNGPVALKDVAARQGISKLYLSQLTGALKHASLLKSVWGQRGGFVLGRPADTICLRDVVEAVDGPQSLIECLEEPDSCPRAEYCKCRSVWRDIDEAVMAVLEKYTVEDLKEPLQTAEIMATASGKETGSR